MYPWQKIATSHKTTIRTADLEGNAKSLASAVSSVLTRFSNSNEQLDKELDSLGNIEIEFDPDAEIEVEESDKGLMESLMEHIALNAQQTKIDINQEFDMLILTLNERRHELISQVDCEKEKKINRLRNKRRKYARSFCLDASDENITPIPRCRSSDDLNLETERDARTIENLRPLQCGDLKLTCDAQMYDTLKEFGKIEDKLASGLHSEAMGLGLTYSFVGEEASFKVVTRDNAMNKTFSEEDNIKVVIRGPQEQVNTALINTKNNGVHTVIYRPSSIGMHKIHVFVNSFELMESPFSCETVSKENLAFEQELPVLPGSENTDGWVLNKEETSALLESNDQCGALIFGATSFTVGKHGWKIKFASACTGVNISLGVSQKTRIVDVDIQHTCNFRLDTASMGHSPLRRTRSNRKMSIFHRETRTFFVLLDMDDGILTIICCETEERKDIGIPKDTRGLFPCVYMVHECTKSVCPRPLVAFS